MALFEAYHVGREEVEKRLSRTLRGDPAQGELAVLFCINRDQFDRARVLLRGSGVGEDFRRLVERRLRPGRDKDLKYISVAVPLVMWDEYAREARLTGRRPSECLANAIRRDFLLRQEVREPRQTLEDQVRVFTDAARTVLDEMRAARQNR